MSGIIDIVVNKNTKLTQNGIKSDQSKIVPKNTNDSLEMLQGIEKKMTDFLLVLMFGLTGIWIWIWFENTRFK